MHDPHPGTESLAAALERDGVWLLRLARALTRDAEAASDAVQTALLRAWERARGRRDGDAPAVRRSWLARVTVNALREDARRTRLRRAREEDAARPERVDAEPSRLERLELQRRVTDALEALPEPMRGTLVLRFLDGLPPRAIAAREGVPVKTVHTRIERGLERLRVRLDARFDGDRSAWVGALLALPHPRWSLGTFGKGALAMGAGAKLAVGGTAVVLLGGLWWIRSGGGMHAPVARTPVPGATEARAEAPLDDPHTVPERRVRAELDSPSATDVPSSAAEVPRAALALQGRVLDVEGQPLAGLAVVARHEGPETRGKVAHEERATSAPNGAFELAWNADWLPVRLALDDERWAGVREPYVRAATASRAQVIVAVPAADLAGRVLDENGLPVPEASVSLETDGGLLVDFPLALDSTVRVSPRAVTDAEGRFSFQRTPVAPGSLLRARKRGFESDEHPPAEPYAAEQVLTLRTLKGDERVPEAEGLVLLPDGRPAVGATVHYGLDSTRTDRDGRFHLPLDYSPDPDLQLAAALEGYGAALVERYGELQQLARPYAPAPVVLVLHGQSLELSGHVVDARGAPLVGWQVQLDDGTTLTRRQTPPVLAETLLEGNAENQTSEDGSFTLHGLLDRDYTLFCYDPASLRAVRAGPFPAGARGVRIEVPDGQTFARIAGRLVSRHGLPVSGARVSVARILHRMEWGHSWVSGTEVTTDAEGRFELHDVPRDTYLTVLGEGVVPQDFELEPERDLESLELEIAQRCHFRVEVHGSGSGRPADLERLAIQVEDGDAKPLPIHTFTAQGSSSQATQRLVDGRMEIAAVSEDAVEVVLYRDLGPQSGGLHELARRALDLVPGEVCEVGITLE